MAARRFTVHAPNPDPKTGKPTTTLNLGHCPHTVTVYNRATIKLLIYLDYEYYSTVTEWGQYPSPT